MKQNKWLNFWGSMLAASTLCLTAHNAKKMRKKYGERNEKFFISDFKYFCSYAIEKLVFNNPKVIQFLDQKFHLSEL